MLASQQGRAVDLAESLKGVVDDHVATIRLNPESQDTPHHAGEARGILKRIENLTGRMRGNTQEAWRGIVKTIRDEVDHLAPLPER